MLKTIEKAIIASFLLSTLISMTGFSGQCEKISEKILRLHVIANSDSEEDQSLKLKVRDKVLSSCADKFDSVGNLQDAESIIVENIDFIKELAKEEVYSNGFDCNVDVELKDMYFNTRHYNSVTIPAGKYRALRITIGEGKGKNWWCVMFPPMCLPTSEEQVELEEVLSTSEMDIVEREPEYEIKFKFLEAFQDFRNWLRDSFDFLNSIEEVEII